MSTYNVLARVVDLVEAATPEAAVRAYHDRLRAAGFEVHEDGGDVIVDEVFESEPLAAP